MAPSHGPLQKTTAPRPALKEPASASEAPSFLPAVPTARQPHEGGPAPAPTQRNPPHCTPSQRSRAHAGRAGAVDCAACAGDTPSALLRTTELESLPPLSSDARPSPRLHKPSQPSAGSLESSASFPTPSPLCFHPRGRGRAVQAAPASSGNRAGAQHPCAAPPSSPAWLARAAEVGRWGSGAVSSKAESA